MIKFLLRRILQMLALFILFLSGVWFLLQLMPGDIATTMVLNPNVPPETADLMRERMGLDQPLLIQYVTYIANFFRGEMGVSFSRYPSEVSTLLWSALPRTLVLFLSATILAFWMGFKSGKIIAWGRGGRTEQGFIVGGVFLQTVFYPWFALVMLWLVGFRLGWFPIGRFIDAGEWRGAPYEADSVFGLLIATIFATTVLYGVARWVIGRYVEPAIAHRYRQGVAVLLTLGLVGFWWTSPMRPFAGDILHHTVLPVVTLGLVAFGATMLLTRSAMIETLGEDYILTARAKGLPDRVIRDKHAARNAMLPVTTSLVLALAFVIGGGIITETIFSWPGMGLLFLDAINVSDIPLAIGALSITGVLALVGHLVADILYSLLDPRIRVT